MRSWRLMPRFSLPTLRYLAAAPLGIGAAVLAERWGFGIPNVPLALLLPVAYSAYGGGLVIGLLAAVMHVIYSAIFFSLPGHPFQYDVQNLERILVIVVVAPAMATMLGNLRHKTELSLRQLTAAKQDLLRLNSKLEMRVEERTAEIVGMIAKTNSEKQAAKTELAQTFDAKIGNLVRVLKARAREMEETAHSMSETAEEAGRVSTLATTFAEHTSTNVRQVAAATDQLAKSAREIGSRALSSADLVTKAVEDARRTDDAVQVMSDRSKRIEQVVKLISDVAGQTNLLALNATVEAARAGAAGKGFGVVASEVKSLAAQTAKAAEEISSQVAQSQEATTAVVGAIGNVGGMIRNLHVIVSEIAAAVEDQQIAAEEIARSVAEAAVGTREVTRNVSCVRQAAAGTDLASSQVLAAATDFSHNASELGREVELFLASIAKTDVKIGPG
jgi:methyl-accepting chemotaxis protein